MSKEELAVAKEKFLVVMQDTMCAFFCGMIELEEFLTFLTLLNSILHAIFHEGGERTWSCEAENHDLNFKKLNELYEHTMKDRATGNDVISWIDDPVKKERLRQHNTKKAEMVMAALEKQQKKQGLVSGHLH